MRRVRQHTWRVLAVAVASALALQASFAPTVIAADAINCSSDTSHFAGMVVSGGQKHGASASIEGQTLHLCLNPNLPWEKSGSWAWAALTDGVAGHNNTIIQVGMGRCRELLNPDCPGSMQYYETWGIDPEASGCAGWARTIPTPFRKGTWDGAAHTYKVHHTSNAWKFYVGSTVIHSQPEADICWTPTQVHFFDESWDEGDAIGGSAGNHLRTSSTKYANTENGTFYSTSFNASGSCTYGPGPGRFCDVISSTSFDVWTNR